MTRNPVVPLCKGVGGNGALPRSFQCPPLSLKTGVEMGGCVVWARAGVDTWVGGWVRYRRSPCRCRQICSVGLTSSWVCSLWKEREMGCLINIREQGREEKEVGAEAVASRGGEGGGGRHLQAVVVGGGCCDAKGVALQGQDWVAIAPHKTAATKEVGGAWELTGSRV